MPLGVLVISLLLTGFVTLLLLGSTRAREQARFENAVQATSDRIQHRLGAYAALLQGASGLFASQDDVDRQEFASYVERLQLERGYPGVRGIGFSRRLSRQELATFEARMRTREGMPDFQAWPEVAGEELHSIVYLEPMDERNRAAIGFNMYSEAVRREAMAQARDSGLPTLSGKVTLKQEIDADKQAGFLLYAPIYRGGRVPTTVEARREALLGFIYSPFRADDLLRGLFGTEQHPYVALQIHDGTEAAPEQLLHSSHEAMPAEPMFTTSAPLSVAGRTWTLTFATLPAFEQTGSRGFVLPLALVGLLMSLALFGVTLAQTRAHAREEQRADELRVVLAERARVEEQLREADRRKDEFLAMLGHELRNPLAPMLTSMHLMERKLQVGQSVERERGVMERQVHHMVRLVDDLLDVSRVTRGKIHLQKSPLEATALVGRVVEGVRPSAQGRGHTLRVELPGQEVWTEADPVRLEQVLNNLLHNAIKYTEPGGFITLSLTCESSGLVVRVADTGAGIPAEALPHLFEPFMQVGRTLERAQGGLGLGLTLVKRLVELHGGQVEAASEGIGLGSVFTVRLPLLAPERVPMKPAPAAVVPTPPAPPPAGASRRVLVVDDNMDAADMLAETLSLEGYEVEQAHDGLMALARAATFAPDVVLLDIGLPELDGYEVARRLRQQPGGDSLLLVALTGYGQASDRQRSREAGFNVHFVKPVDLERLLALLEAPPEPRRAQAAPELRA
jgi:signal transduction histidine kinase/ActR/RegA family two-component response regulator